MMNSERLSPGHQIQELDETEIWQVNGGLPFLGAAAVAIAGFALFNGAFSAGKEIGKIIYHMCHDE